ncbi:MAG TPA: hypothetical protein VFR27_10700 [Mycobacterium sp.]|nr:hypothetical protein [Mycobacterium sp.]
MSRFDDTQFMTRWIDAVNADSTFHDVTRWFDGSILLSDGAGQCWLKVYAGAVIDRLPVMPPLGYTFKVSAPLSAWDELVAGRTISDLMLGGRRRFNGPEDFAGDPASAAGSFVIEGDVMTAHRVIAAIYAITDHYAVVARELEAAA